VVELSWCFVDVRDVARAHVLALENPQARGRYLCANLTLTMAELVERVRRTLPGERVPGFSLQGPLGRLVSRAFTVTLARGAADFVQANLGRRLLVSNEKIRRELGLEFLDFDLTLADTVADLRRWGHLAARR